MAQYIIRSHRNPFVALLAGQNVTASCFLLLWLVLPYAGYLLSRDSFVSTHAACCQETALSQPMLPLNPCCLVSTHAALRNHKCIPCAGHKELGTRNTHIVIHTCAHTHTHTHTHAHTLTYTHTCTHTYTHIHTCTHSFYSDSHLIGAYCYIKPAGHTHTHTHTHIHTHAPVVTPT